MALTSVCELNTAVVHQGPVRRRTEQRKGTPETADMLAISLRNYKVCETVFVSDLKLADTETADKETALYAKAVSMNDPNNPDEMCTLVLGMSGTPSVVTLWLYVVGNKKLWSIPIVHDVQPHNLAFLATLAIGIKYFATQPEFYRALEHAQPFKDIDVT